MFDNIKKIKEFDIVKNLSEVYKYNKGKIGIALKEDNSSDILRIIRIDREEHNFPEMLDRVKSGTLLDDIGGSKYILIERYKSMNDAMSRIDISETPEAYKYIIKKYGSVRVKKIKYRPFIKECPKCGQTIN